MEEYIQKMQLYCLLFLSLMIFPALTYGVGKGEESVVLDSFQTERMGDGLLLVVVVIFFIALFIYVLHRKKSEAGFKLSEQKYQILLNNSILGVLVVESANKTLHYANPAICKMLGYSQEEIMNMKIEDIHPKKDFQHILAAFNKKREENKQIVPNIPFLRKDGRVFIADISVKSIMSDGVECNICMIIDVTEKIKAEKVLNDNKEKYKTFFENSHDAMLIIKGGRFIDCNKAAVEMLQYSRKEEFLGMKPDDLSPEFQPDGQLSADKASEMLKLTFKNKSNIFEWTHKKKDGSLFPVEVSLTFIDFGGEEIIHTVWRDISQRKKAENEVIKMQKLRSLGILAGGIAHDFNNILMGIYGNLSLVKLELNKEDPAFDLIDAAEKSMSRATSLTNQLLTFSKGGAPIKELIQVEELIYDVVRFTLSGSNIKPVIKRNHDLWAADADKGQIQQVMSNLIINAKQAMPLGGKIYVTLENIEVDNEKFKQLKDGKYIKIIVRDEGTGIPVEDINSIFDPYFTTKQTGNGLGLATVYSIIDKHNGYIDVSSVSGQGATFTIYIPAFEDDVEKQDQKKSKIKVDFGSSPKILIMDDTEALLKLLSKSLLKQGFEVETAINGEEVIEKYKEHIQKETPFDVVCMDLTIPGGMGGAEAVKELIRIDPNVKAVVLSGYSNDPVMANFKDYGFVGKLTKPFGIKEFHQELIRVIET
jgi:PAS domain S-box-containing protein